MDISDALTGFVAGYQAAQDAMQPEIATLKVENECLSKSALAAGQQLSAANQRIAEQDAIIEGMTSVQHHQMDKLAELEAIIKASQEQPHYAKVEADRIWIRANNLIEATPYADFKTDERVMVSSDGVRWRPRYFDKEVDGVAYCFERGRTSWTIEGYPSEPWNYCRRPTEEELKESVR